MRDIETHECLPGIEIGDIGVKLGYNSVDNGYLRFDHFRVPRTSLLSRFIEITREGEFKIKGNPKIIYQVMLQTRITILNNAAFILHRGAQIAIRYAACRRQFTSI